ncbi:C-5 sterol desaturase [Penicillium soppii]|uniref:C-5 sterol desaturase n=1 Tax=Penicillium soppii TaxID=69789 RepID=UPI002546CEAE|nr:C-5 sterol desaturase [Penicillium soppii]KAJ5882515.1 C-5 sterol desaturase [Penicillium soppii]
MLHAYLNLYGLTLTYNRSFHLLTFLVFGTYSYIFNFDHALKNDKRFRKYQIRQEIKDSTLAIVAMDITNVPVAMLQLNGCSFLYDSMVDGPGLWYEMLQYPLAILFMDTGIYWLHWMYDGQKSKLRYADN